MNSLVSICIPTYRRPALLREAIESCLQQTYREIEILVGDDSQDDASARMVQALGRSDVIRYFQNKPALRQAENINRLLDLAKGSRLVLLHDDDLLLPDAVESLLGCWQKEPGITAAFGKQYLITMSGEVLLKDSEVLNEGYHRRAALAGLQESSLKSALVCQFPNNGYLILTEAARTTRYSDRPEVGDYCDLDFGLRLASRYERFYFIDRYTAKYRLTDSSISKVNLRADLIYRLIQSVPLPEDLEPVRADCLRANAWPALNSLLALGDMRAALEIYSSRHYGLSRRLSPRGLAQGLLLAAPTRFSMALMSAWLRLRR